MRRHCIKLDQEEDQCQAIDAESLPEDGRRTTMQQQVASQLWSHHTEEYDANHTQAEVPTDAMAPGRHVRRASAIRSILCGITLNVKKTGDSDQLCIQVYDRFDTDDYAHALKSEPNCSKGSHLGVVNEEYGSNDGEDE